MLAFVPTLDGSGRMDKDRRKLLLIADDYDSSAELLADLVKWETTLEAVAVLDGEEALDFSRRRRPDAAVLDVDMPRIGGIVTAREMRAMFARQPPLLIGCSGAHAEEARRASVFDHVLQKPIEPDELLRLLSQV